MIGTFWIGEEMHLQEAEGNSLDQYMYFSFWKYSRFPPQKNSPLFSIYGDVGSKGNYCQVKKAAAK